MTGKVSNARGETIRELAQIVRGILKTNYCQPEEIPNFLNDLAEANDTLLEDSGALQKLGEK